MKLVIFILLISLLCSFLLKRITSKHRKRFLKTLSPKLELDHLPCQKCMFDFEKIKNDPTKHEPCPMDKNKKCARCSINTNNQDGCRIGCFRMIDGGAAGRCLIERDYDNLYKNKKLPSKTPKPDDKVIEVATKNMFVVKPSEFDTIFFLIDSSGSMNSDTKICWNTMDYDKYQEFIKSPNYKSRINVVKEVLKKKIQGFPDNQKYFIWESDSNSTFDSLKGTRSKSDALNYIDGIKATNKIFYYEDAFKVLYNRINKMENTNKSVVVSIITDGGITSEYPSKSETLDAILKKGVKTWELFLYTEGGCNHPDIQEQEKSVIDDLRRKVDI